MAIRRITLSVPEALAARLKRAAGDSAVSAWVTHVLEERLDEVELERKWSELYREVSPDKEARRRAEAILRRGARRGRGNA